MLELQKTFCSLWKYRNASVNAKSLLFSEARKFGLHFIMANQFLDQFSPTVRAALVGNVGTMVIYRVGGHDAELLAPEFHPGSVDAGLELSADFRRVLPGDLVAQEPFTAWLRRGVTRDRIYAAPKLFKPTGAEEAIRAQSAARFGRPLQILERRQRHQH